MSDSIMLYLTELWELESGILIIFGLQNYKIMAQLNGGNLKK
jgi:hypothetical protein